MGVHGLWELLAPVGRRVSVETLAGKRLAIDASIWMIQFIKAMRDEKGEMVRNAHVLGFFRRILKLLFLRTKPVFVFDGGTPALKRRTVAARRRHRENAQAKIRKTAEKLLLNHLKTKRLEELAEEIKRGNVKEDSKGKKVVSEDGKEKKVVSEEVDGGKKATRVLEQENFDAMLAASIAAEEEELAAKEGASSARDVSAEEEDDGDEEMIFPVASGKIDPAVLASLPPSMQLDLLVQMRESVMAENRQKYQKIKKAPSKFSELQIQSYLKTVAFRREIDEVQKCAAGRGLEGVQTSRIASEANREFIFSSSFTGDKQMLSSTVSGNGDKVNQASKKPITWDPVKCNLFSNQSKSSTDASVNEVTSGIGHGVESYHDERGQFRVSRVRGLGIRMTRDLQRNLDLMKEYEQESSREDMCIDPNPKYTKEALEDGRRYPGINESGVSIDDEENNTSITGFTSAQEQLSVIGSKSAIEISFPEDDTGIKDTDDDLFLHLVSGNSTSKLCSGSILPYGSAEDSDSECVWEEGLADEIAGSQKNDQDKESHFPTAEDNCCDDEEVEWEEGISLSPEVVTDCPTEQEKVVSLGILEEEADIQEAIKRSLQGIERQKSLNISSASASLGISMGDRNVVESCVGTHRPFGKHPETSPLPSATSDGHTQLEYSCMENLLQTSDSAENQSPPSTFCGNNFNQKMSRAEENKKLISSSVVTGSNLRTSQIITDLLPEEGIGWVTSGEQCSNGKASSGAETVGKLISSTVIDDRIAKTSQVNNVPTEEGTKNQVTWEEPCMDSTKQSREAPILGISREDNVHATSNIESETVGNLQHPYLAREHINHSQSSQSNQSSGRRDEGVNSLKTSVTSKMVVNSGLVQGDANESICNTEGQPFKGTNSTQEKLKDHNLLSEANFGEEISLLKQERANLGEEQRRLESIAESVSSEMFAECQELLQMFGLPYIIAPMEAEAQCAYMEMLKLVDGVVTDDSDVFLFGARSVYKNIFDDRKYVETYFMKDIESELGLSRETLIRMALLLGSDYTEGVSGIGIVNAIEVVRAFPEEDGLQKFREWIESPDPAIFGKLGTPVGNSKRKASKSKKKDMDGMVGNAEACASKETTHEAQLSASDIQPIKDIFMNKHRNVSKNWHLPSSFPSEAVITAYISPQVDGSSDSFSWGKPDLFLLRKLCWERFGWNIKKADELLLPVIKEYNKHETQLRLEAFYTFNERFAKIRSERIKKAVKGITGKCSTELMDDLVHEGSGSGKKKGSVSSGSDKCKYEVSGSKRKGRAIPSLVEECKPDSCEGKSSSKSRTSKRPGRQKSVNPNTESENGVAESVILKNDKSRVSESARGRRRRGSGRGRGRERRKEKNVITESTESSPSDCEETVEMEKHTQVPGTIRRSTRHRKDVKYAEGNVELDDASDSMDQERVDVNVHREHANDSPHDSFSRDYVLSGGGFCMEETERDALHRGASPIRFPVKKDSTIMERDASTLDGEHVHSNLMVEDDDSKDYLLSGGGFCTNENDTQEDVAQQDPSSTPEDLDHGRKIKEPKHDDSAVAKNVHLLYPDNADGESQPDLGLRAMPLLRRKRRKV